MAKKILPCCLFPTTVVIVDDDATFLKKLKQLLRAKGIIAQAFVNPEEALAFINSHDSLDLDEFYNTSVDISDNHSVYETVTDLSAILKLAHNEHRSEKLGVVVSDYNMLPINGLQMCESIKSPNLKKVLLTAVAGDHTAVGAFNDGLIDQFISKGEQQLSDKLVALIKDLQFTLFAEQSLNVYKLYENAIENKLFLRQKAFLNWFKQLLSDNQFSEFYLVTEFSMIDFLMISNVSGKKKAHWLSIRDDDDMYSLHEIANTHGSTEDILQQLKEKKVMPVVMNDTDGDCPPDEWEKILHPVNQVKIDDTIIYYTLVEVVKDIPINL